VSFLPRHFRFHRHFRVLSSHIGVQYNFLTKDQGQIYDCAWFFCILKCSAILRYHGEDEFTVTSEGYWCIMKFYKFHFTTLMKVLWLILFFSFHIEVRNRFFYNRMFDFRVASELFEFPLKSNGPTFVRVSRQENFQRHI
jgi:hypothetical protein